jgi:hypothetical protein
MPPWLLMRLMDWKREPSELSKRLVQQFIIAQAAAAQKPPSPEKK